MAKKGFPVQSQDALDKERRVAGANDGGNKKNVTNSGDGYSVSEETRRFFAVSLQSVGAYLYNGEQHAVLTSRIKHEPPLFSDDNKPYVKDYRIVAYSNGEIDLHMVSDPQRLYGRPVHETRDVTKILSNAGITAADIRQMQKNIAFDGEVDRSEQEKIINVVNTALRGLGEQPHR